MKKQFKTPLMQELKLSDKDIMTTSGSPTPGTGGDPSQGRAPSRMGSSVAPIPFIDPDQKKN